MLINPLWLISFIKRRFIYLFIRVFASKKSLSELFMEQLEYPVCKEKLSEWIALNNPYNIKNNLSPSEFKIWVKNLKEEELIAVHRYYNTLRFFSKSRIVFHEILRRHLSPLMIFRLHGTKKYIVALMLLSQITNKYKNNSWIHKFTLRLFLIISHPSRKINYLNVIKGKTIALIGGGSEKGRGTEIDSTEIVARLNNFEINESQFNDIGKRTDIVFLRGERSIYLYKTEGSEALKPYNNT